jgi:hypothetical protein
MLEKEGLALAGLIERTSVSKFLQNLPNEVPITQSIHLIGVCLLFGAAASISLRLLGWMNQDLPVREVVERYLPPLRIGLVIAALSGIVMLGTEPSRSLPSTPFHWKLVLLVAVLIGTRLFVRVVPKDDATPVSGGARALAACYLVALALIVAAGRWIAYAA